MHGNGACEGCIRREIAAISEAVLAIDTNADNAGGTRVRVSAPVLEKAALIVGIPLPHSAFRKRRT